MITLFTDSNDRPSRRPVVLIGSRRRGTNVASEVEYPVD
jgi:hypothetical protein